MVANFSTLVADCEDKKSAACCDCCIVAYCARASDADGAFFLLGTLEYYLEVIFTI